MPGGVGGEGRDAFAFPFPDFFYLAYVNSKLSIGEFPIFPKSNSYI